MKKFKLIVIPVVALIIGAGGLFLMQCDMGGDGDGENGGEGADVDLSDYYQKTEVDTLLADAALPVYAIATGSTQSIPVDTWTTVDFDFEHADTHDMYQDPDSKMTCQSEGLYLIKGEVIFLDPPPNGFADTIRGAKIIETSIYNIGNGISFESGMLGEDTPVLVDVILPMAVGDTVQLQAYHDYGDPVNASFAKISK
jgi:hypothetical protein